MELAESFQKAIELLENWKEQTIGAGFSIGLSVDREEQQWSVSLWATGDPLFRYMVASDPLDAAKAAIAELKDSES